MTYFSVVCPINGQHSWTTVSEKQAAIQPNMDGKLVNVKYIIEQCIYCGQIRHNMNNSNNDTSHIIFPDVE